MSDFLKSNPALDAAITNADNFEAMREQMLATLAAQGQVVRSRTNAYDVRVIRPPEPEVPLPASGYKFQRELRFHPESGKRPLMLRANSLEDLDDLERQILGYQ